MRDDMSENKSNTNQEVKEIDLLALLNDSIHSLKRLWWVVILCVIAGGLVSFFSVNLRFSPKYVAEGSVEVTAEGGSVSGNRSTAKQMSLIFPYILSSSSLSDIIASEIGTTRVPGSISTSYIDGTNVLSFKVTSGNAEQAYEVLKSVIKNYPDAARYVVGQVQFEVLYDSGVPVDSGKTSAVRGSLRNGLLLGLIIGLAIVLLRAFTIRTVRSENELRALVNVPFLGNLPICQKKERRSNKHEEINILFDANRENYTEAMRLIRTRIDRKLDGKKVLMVTSSVAGEGKSTVAANLAVSMALKGKSVILVDCDLRNPSSGKIFNITGSYPGLAAVLDGSVKLNDALVEVVKDGKPTGLRILPGADKQTNSIEILGSEAMHRVIDELRGYADIIILDTPPSAVLVDAMMMTKHVDGVAYVVMSDYARRRYIVDGIEELTSIEANLLGCILNGSGSGSGGYGYYGRYGHYGRYGYYGYGHYSSYYGKTKSKKKK